MNNQYSVEHQKGELFLGEQKIDLMFERTIKLSHCLGKGGFGEVYSAIL